MEKNISFLTKRISSIKQSTKVAPEDSTLNQEIIILTEMARLKKFKYEDFDYMDFVK